MRAHTITTIVVLGALAIPVSASAVPIDSGPYSVNAITGGGSDSDQPAGGSNYSSVNATAPPASEPSSGGSADVDPGYSSLSAISGAPASEPTLVSGPSGTDDGFDWASAAIGAGAAMALVALSGAAFLTVRRHKAVSPSVAS
jgi:hypothetical protein